MINYTHRTSLFFLFLLRFRLFLVPKVTRFRGNFDSLRSVHYSKRPFVCYLAATKNLQHNTPSFAVCCSERYFQPGVGCFPSVVWVCNLVLIVRTGPVKQMSRTSDCLDLFIYLYITQTNRELHLIPR